MLRLSRHQGIGILTSLVFVYLLPVNSYSQLDTITIGFGENMPNEITASSAPESADNTLNQAGFLPNYNAASRMLSQATLGYNFDDIEYVASVGIEDWLDLEFEKPTGISMVDKVKEYHQTVIDSVMDPDATAGIKLFDYAWWQYHMVEDDYLRQRVAFALSEIFVISRFSSFSNKGYAFAGFYDILLNNAFGNFRDLIEDVTYQPSMGRYLTYLNNPKSDTLNNQFPDENYARELMQLFTIGLYELNADGSWIYDANSLPIPTYDNEKINEFAKIFTGLSWADRPNFGYSNPTNDTTYYIDMLMFNSDHEPGEKFLLNDFVVPDRDPVDGDADIADALDNLFEHDNVGPFIGYRLIQRLVTSNPSPEYVERITQVFNDNGEGVRGDLKAVIKAILLDPEANTCSKVNDIHYGMLREPFVRYIQLNKAFYISTESGNHRNFMDYVYEYTGQKPFASPSVFNFFQYDYQPIGDVADADKFGPEFQITNAQTIAGFINGLNRWLIKDNPADEYDLFSGEENEGYADEIASLDVSNEIPYTDDNQLHILMDRLNMVLAQGRVSDPTLDIIIEVVSEYPNDDEEDKDKRVRIAAYLLMSSPEYLIKL